MRRSWQRATLGDLVRRRYPEACVEPHGTGWRVLARASGPGVIPHVLGRGTRADEAWADAAGKITRG